MATKKSFMLGTTVLILSMLACSLQTAAPSIPTELSVTNTPVDLAAALAASLTAIANQASPTETPTYTFTSTFTAVPPTATSTTALIPSLAPTITATPTRTATPTQPPTPTNTKVPTGTSGVTPFHPILKITLLPIHPITQQHLDYTASANYGEANLSAGFSPDPYSVGMTTGGPVDVSYLGSSCTGFASVHPDLRINFGGGGAALLRIYFIGSNGDAAMVLNDPYGNYYCVDDSFGTVNPTIDFNNPAGGTYEVWIGSYAANTNISGTLYITGNSGNHP